MRCTWSADRFTLTCRPDNPLGSGTRYTLHMGGGLRDEAGRRIDMPLQALRAAGVQAVALE